MSLSGNAAIFGIRPHVSGSTQLHQLGSVGVAPDGRTYRYANAGAVDLAPGLLCIAVDITANHEDLAVNTFAVGDKSITVTLGATAITANEYDGGYVNVTDATGQGIMYQIESAPATDASGSVIIQLKTPIVVAAEAATTVTLVRNKYKDIIVSDGTQADLPVGVPNVAISAGEFGWVQTGGFCSVLNDTTTVVAGQPVTIGDADAGAVEVHNAATEVVVGVCPAGTVAAAGEYTAIELTLD
jgi:hypothetical protein